MDTNSPVQSRKMWQPKSNKLNRLIYTRPHANFSQLHVRINHTCKPCVSVRNMVTDKGSHRIIA